MKTLTLTLTLALTLGLACPTQAEELRSSGSLRRPRQLTLAAPPASWGRRHLANASPAEPVGRENEHASHRDRRGRRRTDRVLCRVLCRAQRVRIFLPPRGDDVGDHGRRGWCRGGHRLGYRTSIGETGNGD